MNCEKYFAKKNPEASTTEKNLSLLGERKNSEWGISSFICNKTALLIINISQKVTPNPWKLQLTF